MSYIHCSTKLYDFGWCHDIFHPQIQIIWQFSICRSGKGKFAFCLTRAMEFRFELFIFDAEFNWLCWHPYDFDNMVTTWLTGVCNFLGSWELNSRKLPQLYFASKFTPTFKFLLMYHLLFLECSELPRIAFHQDRGKIKRNKLLLKLLLRTNLNLIFRNFVMRR